MAVALLVGAVVASRSSLQIGWDLVPFLVAFALASRAPLSRRRPLQEDWVRATALAFALVVFLAFGAVEAALLVVAGSFVVALLDWYSSGSRRRVAHVFRTASSVIGMLAGGIFAGLVTDASMTQAGDANLIGFVPFLLTYFGIQVVALGVLYWGEAPVWDVRSSGQLTRMGRSPLTRALAWEGAALLLAALLALIIDAVGLRLDYWVACILAFVVLVGISRLLELNSLLRERNGELAHAMSELRTLNDVGQVLSATIDPDRLCVELATQFRRLTRLDAIVIALVDPARTRVRIAYYDYAGIRQPERFEAMPEPAVGPPVAVGAMRVDGDRDPIPGDGIVSQVLATRRPVVGADIETFALVRPDGTTLPAERSGVRQFHSAVGIPLQVGGDLIGAIALKAHRSDAFDRSLIDLLSQIGNQAALAIRNAEVIASERASTRARQDFLTVVSHELRTPITSISGYSQLLTRRLSRDARDTAASTRVRPTDMEDSVRTGADPHRGVPNARTGSSHLQIVEVISEQSRRLGRLVDDLVTLSGLGQGNMRFDMEAIGLAGVVAEAVEGARLSMDDSDCLRLEVASDPRIVGDHRRIREVFDNLIGNAITHGPAGTMIEVWVGERTGAAEVRISDRGKGIAMSAQAHVFEPFYRGDVEEGELQSGLGLGLSISREIVVAHGGTISVLSDEGAGATFIVRFQPTGPDGSDANPMAATDP
jgi:signal transduction histidine kinase